MAFTEQQVLDRIEIVGPYLHVQVRHAAIVLRDGVEIARQYSRVSLNPGDDVSAQPAEVQAVAAALWTPEVVSAYQASIA